MSKNDVTGDEIKTKQITDAYRKNFDEIFKRKQVEAGYTGTIKPLEEQKDTEERQAQLRNRSTYY